PREIPFDFRGQGLEYFRIWIVNILLTILTLGIYSAWAKVRNQKYFYNHMYLDGHNFDYLADPVRILIGRVIALGVFLLMVGVAQFFPLWGGLALTLTMLLVFPWIILASLRFRNRYSAYKNIRFDFHGSYSGCMVAFMLWPALGVLTLGLLLPLAWYKMRAYIVENSTYGVSAFEFDATAGDYYLMSLKLIGFTLLATFAIGGAIVGIGLVWPTINILAPFAGIFIYLFLFAYFNQVNQNLQWNNTGLRTNSFASELKTGELMSLYFVNALLLLVTLGLAFPLVKIRIARYFASRVSLVAQENLDNFIAGEQEQVSAIGQEVGDFLDFDIGL
ncbi:MAG: YjgN family protein, partial [Pseudomonadales bacterium]